MELLSVPRRGSSAREYVYEALKKNIILLHLNLARALRNRKLLRSSP